MACTQRPLLNFSQACTATKVMPDGVGRGRASLNACAAASANGLALGPTMTLAIDPVGLRRSSGAEPPKPQLSLPDEFLTPHPQQYRHWLVTRYKRAQAAP